MRIDILSLFPQMFDSPFSESIIKRAIDRGLVSIFIHNIRDYTHDKHQELSIQPNLILLCGHYEGVDERVRKHLVTDEVSIGEYVLTGGELAAMVVVDAVVRLLPGVLSSEQASQEDSYAQGFLEYPQYTRPQVYRGWEVPPVLLSGNHQEIATWRREQAIQRTLERRPDLLGKAVLSEEERRVIEKVRQKGTEHEH